MKITMLGSLGHINSFVIPELIKNGHEVTVISHSPNRQKDIEKLGAKSAIGSMMDVDFLTETFSGSDLVYLMYSSTNEDGDPVDEARKQAEIFKSAIDRSNVKHVVDLSSVGADQGPEVGGLYIYNVIESILKELSNVTYTFVRPTGFYTNLFGFIPTIKKEHRIVRNYGGEVKSAWVDPRDIAKTVSKAILNPSTVNSVEYVASDILTGNQLVDAISQAIDMPDLKWVQISDEEMQNNLEKTMPVQFAKVFTKMYQQQSKPVFYADFYKHEPQLGDVKINDFMKTFATVYKN